MTGVFITIEGIEGAGKSTALSYLERYFQARGRSCLLTREPGGTVLGEQVRRWLLDPESSIDPSAETLLMFAARAQHLATVIRPALNAGKVVICDRFTDATYAYQGEARGLGQERIAVLERWTQAQLRPDLTLLLDLPVAESALRLERRRSVPDRIEREGPSFFERVRAAYLARAAQEPQRIRCIDARQRPEDVESALQHLLSTAGF
ncbi:MAG TPA: dTMP kinase [Acidiferrobacteraceae bacterium]|nr:dTMP kinase [Acidiferrobacteraceae bacterium]